jgi:hypothetical protein
MNFKIFGFNKKILMKQIKLYFYLFICSFVSSVFSSESLRRDLIQSNFDFEIILHESAKLISDLFQQQAYSRALKTDNTLLAQIAFELHNSTNLRKIRTIVSPYKYTIQCETPISFDVNELYYLYRSKIDKFWALSSLYEHPELLEKEDERDWCLFVQSADNLNYLLIKDLIEILNLKDFAKNSFRIDTFYSGPRFNFLWVRRDSLLRVSRALGFPLSLEQQKRLEVVNKLLF